MTALQFRISSGLSDETVTLLSPLSGYFVGLDTPPTYSFSESLLEFLFESRSSVYYAELAIAVAAADDYGNDTVI